MADFNISLIVKELRNETEDCLSIVFEKPKGLLYESGNWMDIRFPIPEFPVGKTYSFASSPTEPDLMITFRKGVSKFKKALESVKPGNTMLITQYGSNGFILNKNHSTLFIAGGVGITPFRSMIKETIDTNSKVDIILLYQNHSDDFPFKGELDTWQLKNPCLTLHYIETSKEGRLTKGRIKQLVPDLNKRKHYIAGSPGFVISLREMLLALGAKSTDVRLDSFDGY